MRKRRISVSNRLHLWERERIRTITTISISLSAWWIHLSTSTHGGYLWWMDTCRHQPPGGYLCLHQPMVAISGGWIHVDINPLVDTSVYTNPWWLSLVDGYMSTSTPWWIPLSTPTPGGYLSRHQHPQSTSTPGGYLCLHQPPGGYLCLHQPLVDTSVDINPLVDTSVDINPLVDTSIYIKPLSTSTHGGYLCLRQPPVDTSVDINPPSLHQPLVDNSVYTNPWWIPLSTSTHGGYLCLDQPTAGIPLSTPTPGG